MIILLVLFASLRASYLISGRFWHVGVLSPVVHPGHVTLLNVPFSPQLMQ